MADLSNGCQIGISEWASQGGGIRETEPPGFEMLNSENKVCKLKKALYGLKQAPRAWNKIFKPTKIINNPNMHSFEFYQN